jgi:Sulfotransferase family
VEEGSGVNPYTFFVGCPRSGTTLLGRMGDAHPDLAVIHETRWIADWFEKRVGLTPEGYVTAELLQRLREHPRFAKLGVDEGTLERLVDGDQPVAYAEFTTSIFDLYGERRRKRLVGDKTPRYVRFLETLSGLWPEARFVHLIRDGRDVCLSVLDWKKGAPNFSTWADDAVSTTALWWEWQVRLGREAGSVIGPARYHELRYESLVAEPERECAALCEFLGLSYDPAMLRFHEGRTRDDPRLDAKKAWRPVTQGLRAWKSELPVADVVRFETAAGALLDELGYERVASPANDEQLEHATRIRDRLTEEVRARGRQLPREWSNGAG